MPKVSVIIPFYNTPLKYMREVLRSVRSQTFTDCEVIVVNDGSPSDVSRELERTLSEFEGMTIRSFFKENGGVSSALNMGLRQSSGEYVAIVASDDMWYPSKLEKQVDFFEKNSRYSVTYTDLNLIDTEGRILKRSSIDNAERNALSKEEFLVRLLRSNFIQSPTVCVRREVFDRCGFFDESLSNAEDWEMWIRIAKKGLKFYFLDEVLAGHRRHPQNKSLNNEGMKKSCLSIVEKHFQDMDTILSAKNVKKLKAEVLQSIYHQNAISYYDRGDFQNAAREFQRALGYGFRFKILRRMVRSRLRT